MQSKPPVYPAYEQPPVPVLRLTRREAEVLKALATNGYGYREAARSFGIAFGTVNNLMTNARQRMGARNTMQVLYMAMSHGLIE